MWSSPPIRPCCNSCSLAAWNRSHISADTSLSRSLPAAMTDRSLRPNILITCVHSLRAEAGSGHRTTKPVSTDGVRSASTVAANPLCTRCCCSVPASSPGREASSPKISCRSLSKSASGRSREANSSATSTIKPGKWRRIRNSISRCRRCGGRGGGGGPSCTALEPWRIRSRGLEAVGRGSNRL